MRKQEKIIVHGVYELLEPDSESLYVYTRTLGEEKLLVICNFTAGEEEYRIPREFVSGSVLTGNYGRTTVEETVCLKPYEALVIHTGGQA